MKYAIPVSFVAGAAFWFLFGEAILHGIAKAFHAAADFFDRQ